MTQTVENLEKAIAEYRSKGFRLDMIFPADSPREAIMSEPPAIAGGFSAIREDAGIVRLVLHSHNIQPPAIAGGSDWVVGRAGMMYRDLIPGRSAGKVIASHIKILDEGPVADYVHYHKVDFQMIFCLKGRIKVVYEDQGPPFWLEPGDCVVQPPGIRHRVLESTTEAEVLEVSMPAEHETWIDHEMTLPTNEVKPDREFSGQRFVHTKTPPSQSNY